MRLIPIITRTLAERLPFTELWLMSLCISGDTDFWRNDLFTQTRLPTRVTIFLAQIVKPLHHGIILTRAPFLARCAPLDLIHER